LNERRATPQHADQHGESAVGGTLAPTYSSAGIALMSAASLLVPVVDGMAKILGAHHSPDLVAWGRYAVASLIVLPLNVVSSGGLRDVRHDFGSNMLRTILTVGAMTAFFYAITEIPLATAFGGYFLGPMIAAVLATPVLGEKLTGVRLAAAVLGLIGAYLIVRPGVDVNVGSLLAVLSGILFAGYLVATRMTATKTRPLPALQFQCVCGTILLSPFAIWHWSLPTKREVVLIALMGVISATCHLMVIAAFRFAEASVLSPLAYLELVTATIFGRVVFAEFPDGLAIAGIAVIVVSGLLIWATTPSRSYSR